MVYPVYENPYFKVAVGNCLTAEEAIILKGKIAIDFPQGLRQERGVLHGRPFELKS